MVSIMFQLPMRWPSRLPSSTWGEALMFSCPPAMTMSLSPQATDCAANITAFRPEPQTALMVSAGVSLARPAFITAWRAGFWPTPAASTWPRMTSPTTSAARPLRSSRLLMTMLPSSVAGVLAREPPNLPTAVRAAATITISSIRCLLVSESKNLRPWPAHNARAPLPGPCICPCRRSWGRQSVCRRGP